MSSIATYEMLDGRKVTVDFTDVKSVMKVKKKDWPIIRTILREQVNFVKSDAFRDIVRNNLRKTFHGS